jgi:hypothetical protein
MLLMKRILPLIGALALAAFAAGPGSAQAPLVSTAPASNVAKTTATLNGYLNPPSAVTEYFFVYGTSTNYGQHTPIVSNPSGSGLTAVSANVTGLLPNTTYHYELVAGGSEGGYLQAYTGGDQTFTTNSSGGSGSGSGGGALRLVSKSLSVKGKKVSISLWCTANKACSGSVSISASRKTCVSGAAFSIGAGKAKVIKATVRKPCRSLLSKARKHRHKGMLTATYAAGQSRLRSKVTLVRHK